MDKMIQFKYGVGFSLSTILLEAGSRNAKSNPTLASGDVKISKDGAAFANISTLPTVTPTGGVRVEIEISATEAQCHELMIRFVDQTATAEWEEQTIICRANDERIGMLALNRPAGFQERSGIVSQQITRSGYPSYVILYTTSTATPTDSDFDPRLLLGALIGGEDSYENTIILGGFFFTDSSDEPSKVFGIASDDNFGIKNGDSSSLSSAVSNWTNFADPDGSGNMWVFICADPFDGSGLPGSGKSLEIYMNPAKFHETQITNQAIEKWKQQNIDNEDGDAFYARSQSCNAHAMNLVGGTAGGAGLRATGHDGISAESLNAGEGILAKGEGAGSGMKIESGATTAVALDISGSSNAVRAVSAANAAIKIDGASHGIEIDAATNGIEISASAIGIRATGTTGIAALGSSVGLNLGGDTIAGTGGGLRIVAQGTDDVVEIAGTGTQKAINITSVNGECVYIRPTGSARAMDIFSPSNEAVYISSSGASKNAVSVYANDGNAIKAASDGGFSPIKIENIGTSGDGLEIIGHTSGKDLNAKEIGTPVTLGDGASLSAMLTALAGKTASAGSYDRTTDSNEAIRDRGDSEWSGASGITQQQVRDAMNLSSSGGAEDPIDQKLNDIAGVVTSSLNGIVLINDKVDIIDENVDSIMSDGVSLNVTGRANVNSEMVDVIYTDTIPELPVAQPPKNPTIAQAVMLKYMIQRNEHVQTGSLFSIKNDSGAVIAKSTLDLTSGVSVTAAKMVAGDA